MRSGRRLNPTNRDSVSPGPQYLFHPIPKWIDWSQKRCPSEICAFLESSNYTDAKKIPEKLIYWHHFACFFQKLVVGKNFFFGKFSKTNFFAYNLFLDLPDEFKPKKIFWQILFWKKTCKMVWVHQLFRYFFSISIVRAFKKCTNFLRAPFLASFDPFWNGVYYGL